MNFKGTTNIPRDKVKGIIEKFGGYWNGYTWIDQTTYTETAPADALDHMLFIEAERMANCLYDPADCESERTVIISELQGGENDPDTLLEQELTARPLQAHPYRIPTIGWLSDLESNDAVTISTGTTGGTTFRTTRRWSSSATSTLRDALRSVVRRFGGDRAGRTCAARIYTREPAQLGERR